MFADAPQTGKLPLHNHVLFETADVDRARDLVAGKFCSHRLDPGADRARFAARHHHVAGALLSLNYISYGADVVIEPGELETFYLIQLPLTGAATIANGRKTFVSNRRTASVLNPDRPTRMTWWQGCSHALLQIDKQALTDFAERLLRRDLAGGIVFDPVIDLTDRRLAAWRALAMQAFAAADSAFSTHSPGLSQAYLEHVLLERFLCLQPSNVSAFLSGRPRQPTPRHVHRAEDFIRANAHRNLSIMDIAEASGVSVRSLQYAFRHHHGCSPMRSLENERLRRVRCALQEQRAGISVAETARKWGFAHLGRFAAKYQREFGELPSATAFLS